jgi:hypothetical protein
MKIHFTKFYEIQIKTVNFKIIRFNLKKKKYKKYLSLLYD